MRDDALGLARGEADAGEGGARLEASGLAAQAGVHEGHRRDPRQHQVDDRDHEKRDDGDHNPKGTG